MLQDIVAPTAEPKKAVNRTDMYNRPEDINNFIDQNTEEFFGSRSGAAKHSKGRGKVLDILSHSIALLAEAGPAGFSMRQVATEMGVKVSAIQYYFPSREDLTSAMGLYFDYLLHHHQDQVLDKEYSTPLERLEAFLDFSLNVADASPLLFSVLSECQTSSPGMATAIKRCYVRHIDRLEEVLAPLTPHLSDGQRRSRACLVAAAIDGLDIYFSKNPSLAPSPDSLRQDARADLMKLALM